MVQFSAGVWCTWMWVESSSSSSSSRVRTGLCVSFMLAAGCCLAGSRISSSRCDPPLRVYTPPDETCTDAALLLRKISTKCPDKKRCLRPARWTFCLLLSWFSFLAAPTERTQRDRLSGAEARTALWWSTGGGWVISTTTRGGAYTAGHAHYWMIMSSGLFTVSSHGGAKVPSHM